MATLCVLPPTQEEEGEGLQWISSSIFLLLVLVDRDKRGPRQAG